MLTISQAQMQAFALSKKANEEQRFRDHVAALNRNRAQPLSADALDQLVSEGIEMALSHGIETADAIIPLLTFMLEYGVQFDRDVGHLRWTRAVLANKTLSGKAKVDTLMAIHQYNLDNDQYTLD